LKKRLGTSGKYAILGRVGGGGISATGGANGKEKEKRINGKGIKK
jgi:hypothetical protein